MCEKMTNKEKKNRFVDKSYYMPSILNVNNAVSNEPEFSKAFNCSVNSPMNPEKKCAVW